MRRKIKGEIYNIDTADEVLVGELVGDETFDWWGLYRKRSGEYFRVTFSADGDQVLSVDPLADHDAKELLKARASALVERYFGGGAQAAPCERKLTIRLSDNVMGRLEELAKLHNLSLNAYAAKCLAYCVER